MNQPSAPDPRTTRSSIPPLEPSSNGTPAFNELLQKMNDNPQPPNPSDTARRLEETSEARDLSPRDRPVRQAAGWSFSTQVALGAAAATALPLLVLGGILYGSGQSFQDRAARGTLPVKEIQRNSTALGLSAMGLAVATGAIATFLASRATRQIEAAATASNALINRLRREDLSLQDRAGAKNELETLNANLKLLDEQLPQLLSSQEAEAERLKILMEITRSLREARSEEEVLRVAVEEIRNVFRTDRVAFFRFDSAEDGTIVEESVAPGWPKMLWATLADPCLADYLEQYRKGRVRSIDDIHNAGLNDCHIGLLDRFAVKANLIAPIIKDDRLFGLLIANQCSGPRFWQAVEIDLFAQIASQVGVALDYARLLGDLDRRATQSQLSIDVTRRIRTSLNLDDVLNATVSEVRKAINADRVIVYSFDAQWYGTVIAEAVLPGYPKALWAKIKDPCFAEGYVDRYRDGRVQATPNIFDAGLTQCHLKQLEPFAVKANLVAPILKDEQLFGLLIAHQCSAPRDWLPAEVDWFSQIAMQVGFAIDHARLLEQVSIESVQSKALADITRQIRTSLVEEDVVKTAVTEVRRVLLADRVIVYSFDEEWYGTVVAEAVVPGYPKALWAKIKDPCFAEGYVDQYRDGRVRATANIETEGLTRCHLSQLEPFGVKANLVAPILKDEQLFGLLIAHQCSGPRDWQPSEIDLFSQIAVQVGFALEHARLLDQVERAYQTAETASEEQRHQRAALQHQVSDWLEHSDPVVKELSAQMLQQMESVTALYQHVKLMMTETQTLQSSLAQQDARGDRTQDMLQQGHRLVETLELHLSATQDSLNATTQKVRQLSDPAQKLSEATQFIHQIASQMKLQAMNAALEATRMGDSAQDFANIGEKVLDLARQLDTKTADLTTVLGTLQTHLSGTVDAVQQEAQQIQPGLQLLEQTKQTFEQVIAAHDRIQTLLASVRQSTQRQSESSAAANQVVLAVASRANQASEQAIALSSTLDRLSSLSDGENA
ncbi:GAF domain-containing protein [Altericista sp. CCNU0014]|uniref:GAF domain-containing protein n=1 Tax=Altericista sp. CCNU0014 TaxID=3082949 RepID=UPI00384C1E1D